MFKLDSENVEEPEIKLPTSFGSLKMQENSGKASTSASLIMPKTLLCGSQQILRDGNFRSPLLPPEKPGAGQEATVRTRHGKKDWFQTGERVCQICMLSPCLFNLYAEYIKQNAGLDEA